jgi:integral membrane protein
MERTIQAIPMSNSPIETPAVGELLETNHPRKQLARKIRVTKVMAIVETFSYSLLIPLMFRKYVMHVDESTWQTLLRKVTAYFHGFISAAYGVMILDVFRVMRWSKKFTLLTLAGPPGAVVAYRRLATQPLPADVQRDQMFF